MKKSRSIDERGKKPTNFRASKFVKTLDFILGGRGVICLRVLSSIPMYFQKLILFVCINRFIVSSQGNVRGHNGKT